MTRLRDAIQRVRKHLNLELRTGKIVAVGGTVRDTASGGYYVAILKGAGVYFPPVPIRLAPNAVIDPAIGVPVRIGFDRHLQQDVILAMLPRALQQQGISPYRTNPSDPAAADLIPIERIGILYSRPSTDPSKPLYADVFPGNLIHSSGVVTWAGGSIDLSGFLPTAGNHRYVMVFLKNDFATLEAAGSTEQSTGSTLDDTDLTEAYTGRTAGSIPIRAYKMISTDTELDGNFANSPFVQQHITERAKWATQLANIVYAGPSSGGAAEAAFRALVADDIPSLNASKITAGTLALARGGTNADLSATGPGVLTQATAGANVMVVEADRKLATVTGIDAKTVATTTLFTVPGGLSMVVTKVIIRVTAFTVGSKGIQAVASFGGNAATYDDYLNSVTYTVSAVNKAIADSVLDAEYPIYAAATDFKISIETGSDATTETWAVDLFGYLL